MKTVTYEQFMKFGPCYSAEKIKEIAGDKLEWTALDVLRIDNIPANDRLWSVLRPEFIDDEILHEFACRCAEKALALIKHPDQRSIDAIMAKRAWLRGEISDKQLDAACAAARVAACVAACAAACAAADAAARVAACAAARAAGAAADAAVGSSVGADQVVMLTKMLEEIEK